jgi:hypothetical protein
MKRWMTKALLAMAFSLSASQTVAQQCAGFSDVFASDTLFCPSVEWIKNRTITLGCATPQGQPPGSYYCPGDNVTRLQMAAFMQRLGKALTVEVMNDHVTLLNVPLPGEPPTPPLILCSVAGDSTIVAYPRKALLHATVSALADGNAIAWRAFWLYSVDGGTVFQPIQDGGQNISSPRASSAANQWSGLALAFSIDLPANTPLQVRVGVRRDDTLTGTTGTFVNAKCQMTVSIVNANGSTSPL